jgi:hypothetical protein
VLGVVYAVVIWYAVFIEDTADSVCGFGVAEQDNFFPPYTACGSRPVIRLTSAFAEYAGATLFCMAAAMQICGAVVMIAERCRSRRDCGSPRHLPHARKPSRIPAG